MALDTTLGGTSSDAYLSLVEAEAILTEGRLYSSAWTDASSADQERAIRWATRLLDLLFTFQGRRLSELQALHWPAFGANYYDGRIVPQDIIPAQIKQGTAELALELLKRDRTAEPGLLGLGFREAKLGPINVKVDDSQVLQLLPPSVESTVFPLGRPNASAGTGNGSFVTRLHRS